MKSDKRNMTEGVELLNRVVIRTLSEKEIYSYLRILKADTTKKGKWNKKLKLVSQKNQNITWEKKTLLQESCQRDKYLWCPPRKILGIILEMDQRRT